MGRNRRRRAEQPVTAEGGIELRAKSGGDEGRSAAGQPPAEADGHLQGASGTCGGGDATEEDDGRPRAVATASQEDGHLVFEGGAGLPRAAFTAAAEGHDDSDVIDGQLRAVEIAGEKEGSFAIGSAGRGAPRDCNGDQVLEAWKNGNFLLEAVLKWKVGDISNADLYRHKISISCYVRATIRAQELYCCLYFWMSWLKELDFVLQLEPYCQENCEHEDRMCTKNNLIVFSLESFRSKICELVSEFTECSKDLIRIFSENYLSNAIVENINKLLKELSDFELQIFNHNITSSSVQKAFGFPSVGFVSEDAKCTESLNETRMNILQLGKTLIKSVVLPKFSYRNALEDFCIKSSQIIICTPSNSSRLLELKTSLFDTLLVDDAAQIMETHLQVPLSIVQRRVLLLGDHLHLQPTVKSEVCQKTGSASSLFERLINLPSENNVLTKQYTMDPEISKFVLEHFYKSKVEDGCTIKSHEYNKKLVPYAFIDIMSEDKLRAKPRAFVENAAAVILLKKLSAGLENVDGKLNVAVIYLCSS